MINEIGIRATLDIGDVTSKAAQAEQAIDGMGRAMAASVVGGDLSGVDQIIRERKKLKAAMTDDIQPPSSRPASSEASFDPASAPSIRPEPEWSRDPKIVREVWKQAQDEVKTEYAEKKPTSEDDNSPDTDASFVAQVDARYRAIMQGMVEKQAVGAAEKPQSDTGTMLNIPVSILRKYLESDEYKGRGETEGDPETINIPVSVLRKYIEGDGYEGNPETRGNPENIKIPVSIIREYLDAEGEIPPPQKAPQENLRIPVSVLRDFIESPEYKSEKDKEGDAETRKIPVSILREYSESPDYEGRKDTEGKAENVRIPVSVFRQYLESPEYKGKEDAEGKPESMSVPVSVLREYIDGQKYEKTPDTDGETENLKIPVKVRREYQEDAEYKGRGEKEGEPESIKIPVSILRQYSESEKYEGKEKTEGAPESIEVPVSIIRKYMTTEDKPVEMEPQPPELQNEPAGGPRKWKRIPLEEQTEPRFPIDDGLGTQPQKAEGVSSTVEYDNEKMIQRLGAVLENAIKSGDAISARDSARLILRAQKQSSIRQRGTGRPGDNLRQKPMRNVTPSSILSQAKFFGNAIGTGNVGAIAEGAITQGPKILEMFKGLSGAGMAAAGLAAGTLVAGFAGNALSEAYEKVMQPSMKLAATLDMIDGSYNGNSRAFKLALEMAGGAASKFGYSMQDGIAVMTDLGKYGYNGNQAMNSASKIFAYERGTGADRGLLSQAEGIGHRYNAGNALGSAYGGTFASGMNSGQFQEYLSATLRIFEEGLSRGVVRGFGEITRVQNFIAAIGGKDNPIWQGEQGAARLKTMSDATVSATGLSREYDIIAYQSMDAVIKQARANGFKDVNAGPGVDPGNVGKWSAYKPYSGGTHIDTYKAMEGLSLTPELFREEMKRITSQISGGDDTATIGAIKQLWGVNNTIASSIFDAYKSGRMDSAFAVATREAKPTDSPEQKLLKAQNDIAIALANIGENVLPIKANIMGDVAGILKFLVRGEMQKEGVEAAAAGVSGVLPPVVSDGMVLSGATKKITDDFSALIGKAYSTPLGPKNPDKLGADGGKTPDGIPDSQNIASRIQTGFATWNETQKDYLKRSGALIPILSGKTGLTDLPEIEAGIDKIWKSDDYKKFEAMGNPTAGDIGKHIGKLFSSIKQNGGIYNDPNTTQFYPEYKEALTHRVPGAVDIMRDMNFSLKGDTDSFMAAGNGRMAEIFEAAVAAAKDPKSESGNTVTAKEWEKIASNLMAALGDVAAQFGTAAKAIGNNSEIKVIVGRAR